jgi:3-hydroxypropanoate dehydrogenase
MTTLLSNEALDVLFRQARTHSAWLDKPVSDDVLHQLYDLMKYGPTSANMNPARIVFLRTPEAKQRLAPALSPTNVDKTLKAPRIRSQVPPPNAQAVPAQPRDARTLCQQ